MARKYPIEHCLTILRETVEPGLYVLMTEVWHQLGEMGEDGKTPRRLIDAVSTGCVFRRTRTVSPEALEDSPELGPRPNETLQLQSHEDWTWHMFEPVGREDRKERKCIGFGPRPPEYDLCALCMGRAVICKNETDTEIQAALCPRCWGSGREPVKEPQEQAAP